MSLEPTGGSPPAGYTIDGVPWEEPRGPHLPDAITRQPVLVWPFLAFAAIIVAQDAARVAALPSITPEFVGRSALAAVDSVAMVLLGAAWFWRHRRPGIMPIMAAGLTLLVVVEAMRFVSSWVIDRATALAGLNDDPFAFIRWGGIWSILEGAVTIVALLLVFTAVSSARRRPADLRQRGATILIGILAAAAVGFQTWTAWTAGGAEESVLDVNLSTTLVAIVAIVAGAVLSAALVAGALAGETPQLAWRLGAVGFILPLILTITAGLAMRSGSTSPDFFALVLWFQLTVRAVGALALLAAVALGLPSEEPIPATGSSVADGGHGSSPAS